MASNMFDFPLPFRPVIALKELSNGPTTVRGPYDLKPSRIISSINIYRLWETRSTRARLK
jgi:hypothetical protein